MPVSSVTQTKAMKREQAIVHEALSSCFFFKCSVSQNWGRTDPKCKEGSHEPKLDKQNPQSLHFFCFFFSNKHRLEFLGQASWRKEQNWQTSRKTNVEARKYLLGKWQKRLQSASGYPNNPYKNTQTAPTTTHGRSNQQASAEMTLLALSSVSCKFKVNLLEPRQLEPKGYGCENLCKSRPFRGLPEKTPLSRALLGASRTSHTFSEDFFWNVEARLSLWSFDSDPSQSQVTAFFGKSMI